MGRAGFRPRNAALVLYFIGDEEAEELYARLGKHSRGKAKVSGGLGSAALKRLVGLSFGELPIFDSPVASKRATWATRGSGL